MAKKKALSRTAINKKAHEQRKANMAARGEVYARSALRVPQQYRAEVQQAGLAAMKRKLSKLQKAG